MFSAYLDVRRPESAIEEILTQPASRFESNSWSFFELQHREDDKYILLGYTPESAADRIRYLTGNAELDVTISAHPWESFATLVELPLERIDSAVTRELEVQAGRDLHVLDILLK